VPADFSDSIDNSRLDPIVSVVIPCYNRSKIVGRAIRSVFAQTFTDWELIIVDDASVDSEALNLVVASFNDPRIRLLRHDTNRFAAAARNTGIRASRGAFVAFLDSDDEWFPEKLAIQLTAVEFDPGRDSLVHARAEVITTRDGREYRSEMPARAMHYGESVADYLFLNRGYLPTPSIMLPRRLANSHLFPEHLQIHEDYAMFFALERSGVQFLMPEEVLVRVHWQDVTESGRNLDPASSLAFAKACKDEMSPRARNSFVLNQIVIALARCDRKREAVRYFWREVKSRDLGLLEWANLVSHLLFGDARLPVWCSQIKKRLRRRRIS
jgi:glycosyltransferase involved in cell wall biosynthesis